MKFSKKILPMVLAMAMVPAMSMPAFADDIQVTTPQTAQYSITITNAHGTYKAYQIFSGDLSSDGKLSNVEWGSGVNQFSYHNKNDAVDIAKELEGKGNDSAEAISFAELAKNNIKQDLQSATAQTNSETGKAVLNNLSAGYYVIVNSDVTGNQSVSKYILQVTGNQDVANKAEVPTFEKKLKDKNDSEGTITDWQDSADYDIGDDVPFKLEGVVAANYADYKGPYKFVFHDKAEESLTFKDDTVKVSVDGTTITAGTDTYQLNTTPSDGCTFEVTFPNLKNIKDSKTGEGLVHAGSKITVEYNATLNRQAALGSQGNVNQGKLQFSNNPYDTQGGDTGETPWDNVIVFTYKVVVNKYANEVSPTTKLTGAEFTLEKKIKDKNSAADTWIPIQHVETEATSVFTFKGLDDGEYRLTETTTPQGYNTIDPISFTVTAGHIDTWTGQDRTSILTDLQGTDKNTAEGQITFTATKTTNNNKETFNGDLSTNVINKSGSLLPSTGGIGTTIFYIVGVVLVLGAGVLLVTKKRMNGVK